MKNQKLFKTNAAVSIILIIGFLLTSIFSYKANYKASLDNIEQVSSLTSEGIYYQMRTIFAKPVNVSLTMAHDSLLIEHLSDRASREDSGRYEKKTMDYLRSYQEKYKYDSVFLVSASTKKYYSFNGLDRTLDKGNPENQWYYDILKSKSEYTIKVDNDEVKGADNKITVIINCKIQDSGGKVIGVVGVGMRVDSLKKILQKYEKESEIGAYFLDDEASSKSLPHIQDMKKQTGLRSVGMNTSGIKYWGGRKKHPIWISGPNSPKTASEKVLYPPVIYRNCHGIW